MKTEHLLLYSCLALALLSLLGQVVVAIGPKKANPSKKNDLPESHTWVQCLGHANWSGFFEEYHHANSHLRLRGENGETIFVPLNSWQNEVWEVAPVPHLQLVKFHLPIHTDKIKLLTFLQQDPSILQGPQPSIRLTESSPAQFHWEVSAWIFLKDKSSWQERFVEEFFPTEN